MAETQKTSRNMPPEPSLPGEKRVKETGKDYPLGPEPDAPGRAEPLPEAAIDHRTEVAGSDQTTRPRLEDDE